MAPLYLQEYMRRRSGRPGRLGKTIAYLAGALVLLLGALYTGIISLTSFILILVFLQILKLATRPLTMEFRLAYRHYLRAMKWLFAIMLVGVVLAWLPAPEGFHELFFTISQAFSCLIMVGWTLLVMVYLFNATRVEQGTLVAGVAVYFLLAASWAEFYELLYMIDARAFIPALRMAGPHGPVFDLDSFSLSLGALTTLGTGDTMAATHVARILVNLESAAGNIYLAVMIARLVSLHRSTQNQDLPGSVVKRPKLSLGGLAARRRLLLRSRWRA